MKTFILDIIPRIQRFSQKLENLTVLTNKHWVVIDEEINRKVVFIFREKGSQLLISENGKIEKGTWEYLGNNSLLIDRNDGSYLFKHGFIDDTVLALKVDGKEEYALLVNEHKFDNQLNSLANILSFLKTKYNQEREESTITIPDPKRQPSKNNDNSIVVSEEKDKFFPDDYPQLQKEIDIIFKSISPSDLVFAADIIISYCKDHSINAKWTNDYPELTDIIINRKISLYFIEQLFRDKKNNVEFIYDFENHLKAKINELRIST